MNAVRKQCRNLTIDTHPLFCCCCCCSWNYYRFAVLVFCCYCRSLCVFPLLILFQLHAIDLTSPVDARAFFPLCSVLSLANDHNATKNFEIQVQRSYAFFCCCCYILVSFYYSLSISFARSLTTAALVIHSNFVVRCNTIAYMFYLSLWKCAQIHWAIWSGI